MGGQIDVISEPGRGATFSFDIPLLKVQGDMPARDVALGDGRLLLLTSDTRLRLRLGMLLPNWGLRVTVVENTQEAPRSTTRGGGAGCAWAYVTVLADLAGMRNTALALHRNLERHAIYGDVRLICLYGDEPVPDELKRSVTLIARQAPDAAAPGIDQQAVVPAASVPDPSPAVVSSRPPADPDVAASVRSARVLWSRTTRST